MKLYTIGEIARLHNISIKALRFYDQQDLVKPEMRDRESGYRYYSEKQLIEILVIKELKPLGFSLTEIKSLLKQKKLSVINEKITEKFTEIEENINRLQTQLRILKNVSFSVLSGINTLESHEKAKKNDPLNLYKIQIEEVPECHVVYTRYVSECNANELFLERHVEVQKIRDQNNLYSCGPFTAIFHDHYTTQFFSSIGDLEVYLPIMNENQVCPAIKKIDSFLGATTIHVGRYSEMLPAYLALVEWMNSSGYEINGPAMEQYIVDPKMSDNEKDYVTKIVFPIKKKELS